MTISFSDRVEVPKHVLVGFLDNESVFSNLETEHYYGLDEIGTWMWQAVTAAPYIEAAYEQLLSQFDVEAQQLRQNFSEFLERLVNDGLLRCEYIVPMREWIRQFSALERSAWGLFLRASVLLPMISSSLCLRGFRGSSQGRREI
jgi:hypothetical protein